MLHRSVRQGAILPSAAAGTAQRTEGTKTHSIKVKSKARVATAKPAMLPENAPRRAEDQDGRPP